MWLILYFCMSADITSPELKRNYHRRTLLQFLVESFGEAAVGAALASLCRCFNSQSRSVIRKTMGESPVDLETLTFQMEKTRWTVTRQGHATSAASVDGRSLFKATPLEGRSWRAAALRTPKLMDLLDRRNLCKSSESERVATSSSHRITRH